MKGGESLRDILSLYRGKAASLDIRLAGPPRLWKTAGMGSVRPAAGSASGTTREENVPRAAPSLAREIDLLWSDIARRRLRARRRLLLLKTAVLLAAGALVLPRAWPILRESLALGREGPAGMRPLETGELRTLSLSFPSGRAAGLAIHKGAYLTLDPGAGELAILDPGGRIAVRKLAFPVPSATALSAGEDGLWSIDPASGWIRRHDPETFAAVEKHPAPGRGAEGLLRDGGDLWIADRASSTLFRYAVSEGIRAVSRTPIRPIGHVGGLARAGDKLWLLDADSRTIRRYRINGLSEDGEADLGGALPPDGTIVGLALEGRWVWVMTDSPPTLHRLSAARVRFRRPGLQGFFAFSY